MKTYSVTVICKETVIKPAGMYHIICLMTNIITKYTDS